MMYGRMAHDLGPTVDSGLLRHWQRRLLVGVGVGVGVAEGRRSMSVTMQVIGMVHDHVLGPETMDRRS